MPGHVSCIHLPGGYYFFNSCEGGEGSLNFFVMQGGQDILFSCWLNFASPPPVINNEWSLNNEHSFSRVRNSRRLPAIAGSFRTLPVIFNFKA